MNRFYRKPKPETMKKNRESYAEIFKSELIWLKDNLQTLTDTKNKFMIDMYTVLITGSRKITPKMASAIKNGIEKCKNNPRFDDRLRIEAEEKLKPILEKITLLEGFAATNNDRSLPFIKSVKEYIQKNHRVSKKQLEGLNKIYNKYK